MKKTNQLLLGLILASMGTAALALGGFGPSLALAAGPGLPRELGAEHASANLLPRFALQGEQLGQLIDVVRAQFFASPVQSVAMNFDGVVQGYSRKTSIAAQVGVNPFPQTHMVSWV